MDQANSKQSTKLIPLVENNLTITKAAAASKKKVNGESPCPLIGKRSKRKENVEFRSPPVREADRILTRNRSRSLMPALVNC